MQLTPEIVSLLVDRLFVNEDRAKAMELLDSYGTAAHEREQIRVRIAALKLSEGQIDKLEHAVMRAKRDYRDVLAWAEYPQELVHATWRMSDEEVAQIRGADKAQYLTWLKGHVNE